MRIVKFLVGVSLIPFVLASVYTYSRFFFEFAIKSFLSHWSFWVGILVYPIFQGFIYKPVQLYVIEHELTHALFAILSGGKIRKLSLKKESGSVVVDKTNAVITLSPYFFPLYAVSFFLLWKLASQFYSELYSYITIFYLVAGFLLSFHFFMTSKAILHGQSDLKHSGTIFSLVIIFILYIFVSVFFLRFLFGGESSVVELKTFFRELWNNTEFVYVNLYSFLTSHICPLILKKK